MKHLPLDFGRRISGPVLAENRLVGSGEADTTRGQRRFGTTQEHTKKEKGQ